MELALVLQRAKARASGSSAAEPPCHGEKVHWPALAREGSLRDLDNGDASTRVHRLEPRFDRGIAATSVYRRGSSPESSVARFW